MITIINKILWAIATILIIISGIYFTLKLNFIQFNLKKIISSILKSNKEKKGISPISTLILTLAGKIGVGSIAGIALAIYVGGPGTIFWMWVIGLIAAANTYVETYLGIIYNEKDENNIYKGGPSYYIKKGLNKKKLAIISATLIIVAYLIGFIPIQANTISKSITEIVVIDKKIIGFILSIISAFIIFGGIKKISNTANKIVPIMTILYLLVTIIVIIKNISIIPSIIIEIIKDAFNLKPFFSGFIATLIIGIQRGIFACESGLGTGSIAAATTDDNDPVKTSYIQILGVYITILCICTATCFIIMTSNYQTLNLIDINGIEITQYAFTYHLGFLGNIIIFISILLFAFSTILTGYYYIESCLKFFITSIKHNTLTLVKIITLIFIFIGSIISSNFLWSIIDSLIALLAIINIYALINLKDKIKK